MRSRPQRKAGLLARLFGGSLVERSGFALGHVAQAEVKHRAEQGSHAGGLIRNSGRSGTPTAKPSLPPKLEGSLDGASAQVGPQLGCEPVCCLPRAGDVAFAPASGIDLDDSPLVLLWVRPEYTGGFSSSHGEGSIARRLAGRGGAVVGGGIAAGPGRSNARQEAGVVAADRAHGLLASAALLAQQAAADQRMAAGVRRPRKSSFSRR